MREYKIIDHAKEIIPHILGIDYRRYEDIVRPKSPFQDEMSYLMFCEKAERRNYDISNCCELNEIFYLTHTLKHYTLALSKACEQLLLFFKNESNPTHYAYLYDMFLNVHYSYKSKLNHSSFKNIVETNLNRCNAATENVMSQEFLEVAYYFGILSQDPGFFSSINWDTVTGNSYKVTSLLKKAFRHYERIMEELQSIHELLIKSVKQKKYEDLSTVKKMRFRGFAFELAPFLLKNWNINEIMPLFRKKSIPYYFSISGINLITMSGYLTHKEINRALYIIFFKETSQKLDEMKSFSRAERAYNFLKENRRDDESDEKYYDRQLFHLKELGENMLLKDYFKLYKYFTDELNKNPENRTFSVFFYNLEKIIGANFGSDKVEIIEKLLPIVSVIDYRRHESIVRADNPFADTQKFVRMCIKNGDNNLFFMDCKALKDIHDSTLLLIFLTKKLEKSCEKLLEFFKENTQPTTSQLYDSFLNLHNSYKQKRTCTKFKKSIETIFINIQVDTNTEIINTAIEFGLLSLTVRFLNLIDWNKIKENLTKVNNLIAKAFLYYDRIMERIQNIYKCVMDLIEHKPYESLNVNEKAHFRSSVLDLITILFENWREHQLREMFNKGNFNNYYTTLAIHRLNQLGYYNKMEINEYLCNVFIENINEKLNKPDDLSEVKNIYSSIISMKKGRELSDIKVANVIYKLLRKLGDYLPIQDYYNIYKSFHSELDNKLISIKDHFFLDLENYMHENYSL